ncbi:alpha-amlyase, partial [Citrobacter sp. AAK_AS5]
TRGEPGARVFAVFNLSPRLQAVTFSHARHHGSYRDALRGEGVRFAGGETLELPAWGYRIYAQTK